MNAMLVIEEWNIKELLTQLKIRNRIIYFMH